MRQTPLGDLMIGRRGLVRLVAAVIAISVPAVAASATTAPAVAAPTSHAHATDGRFLVNIQPFRHRLFLGSGGGLPVSGR
jgi:hypothetical protein